MDPFIQLAARAAEAYAKLPNVAAVMLAGSVARNWHDAYSDIELYVLWNTPPADAERRSVIQALGGEELFLHPFEEDEWADVYTVEGIKLEVSGFLVETVNRWIADVTKQYDISLDKQHILASIGDGQALSGGGLISAWKKACPYPSQLAEAMVQEYRELPGRWIARHALVHRRDLFMLQMVKGQVLKQLFCLLFALNRQYVPHPLFKWSSYYIQKLQHIPKDFAERVAAVLTDGSAASVQMLEELIQEVNELIRRQYPHLLPEPGQEVLLRRPVAED